MLLILAATFYFGLTHDNAVGRTSGECDIGERAAPCGDLPSQVASRHIFSIIAQLPLLYTLSSTSCTGSRPVSRELDGTSAARLSAAQQAARSGPTVEPH